MEAAQFQDSEDPEYEDFRTEATLQKRQQIECFNKAAEAHHQRRKDVASFYAQQVQEINIIMCAKKLIEKQKNSFETRT